ncbi:hypothetical protein RRF57_007005 [Xylaria bambusicola]|uniref:Uncharacterized protein n=1 Tax=Xylaria bambusicola TaxID=326684 RepID=A0AAN7URA7_9PEZI
MFQARSRSLSWIGPKRGFASLSPKYGSLCLNAISDLMSSLWQLHMQLVISSIEWRELDVLHLPVCNGMKHLSRAATARAQNMPLSARYLAFPKAMFALGRARP